MRMGWYHMVSEASTERFVFRARAGPLCPKKQKLIGTVSVRVFDVCATKFHIPHEPCVWRHRFSMTTKSPTLNISVFVPSVWDFEKPGETRSPCVFVALLRCAHTLTCIIHHALIWKIHGLVFTTRVEDEFLCRCTYTYILVFLTVKRLDGLHTLRPK